MTIATLPELADWPSDDRHEDGVRPAKGSSIALRLQRKAWIAILLLLLGLMSLAAVQHMKVECRSVLLTAGQNLLTLGRNLAAESQGCELIAGDIRVPLPAWAEGIRKLLL
jgi:hypothetical protein